MINNNIYPMELRSIDLLNGLLTAQSWAGSLRGFFMEEIWVPIAGHKDYEVSNMGRLRSLKNSIPIVLKPSLCRDGYERKILNNKTLLVHRIVANTFISGSDTRQINHKNGMKRDNRVENLEFVSARENTNHHHIKLKGSDIIGVRKTKSGKYSAQIRIDKKIVYLGTFNSEIEASNAYKRKCIEIGDVKYLSIETIKETP